MSTVDLNSDLNIILVTGTMSVKFEICSMTVKFPNVNTRCPMIDISGNTNILFLSELPIILTLILMFRNFKQRSSESYVSNGKTVLGMNLVYIPCIHQISIHGLSTIVYNKLIT